MIHTCLHGPKKVPAAAAVASGGALFLTRESSERTEREEREREEILTGVPLCKVLLISILLKN